MARKQPPPVSTENGPLRITVEKNIVGDFTFEVEKQFRAAAARAQGPVVLDLTAATVVDSRGVALCVGLFKELQRKSIPLSIEASPELGRFFKMLKLDRVMQFSEKGGAR
jgi:anti-anti-sigma factor